MADQNDILGVTARINTGDAVPELRARIADQQAEAMEALNVSNLPDAVLGSSGTAYTALNAAVDFQYAVVPASRLVTSHGLDLTPNPDYDQSLQGRDRGRAASAEQIAGIASGLNPERLGANALVSEGAPVIGPDFAVESGNGRSLGILSAYSQGLPSADAYSQHLQQNAGQFGLDPAAVGAVENPVLVRVRRTEMDASQRATFAADANASSIGVMSDVERANRDAQALLASDILPLYRPSDSGGLNPSTNREFLAGFAGLLPPAERGAFAQADGSASTAGVRQAQNALMAAAYPNADALSRMMESPDDNTRNIANGMLSVSGRMAGLRQGAEAGDLYPLNIGENIADAANLVSRLRDEGVGVKSYLATPSMFDDGPPQITQDLARFMDTNKRSGKRIGEVLNAYVDSVERMGSPQNVSMFDEAEVGALPEPEELFASAQRRVQQQYGELPGGLLESEAPEVSSSAADAAAETRKKASETFKTRAAERKRAEEEGKKERSRQRREAASAARRVDSESSAPLPSAEDAPAGGYFADEALASETPEAETSEAFADGAGEASDGGVGAVAGEAGVSAPVSRAVPSGSIAEGAGMSREEAQAFFDNFPRADVPQPPRSRSLNPENRRGPSGPPDFAQMAISAAMKLTPPPQWALDLFSESTREQGRGQKGLAAAAAEQEVSYQARLTAPALETETVSGEAEPFADASLATLYNAETALVPGFGNGYSQYSQSRVEPGEVEAEGYGPKIGRLRSARPALNEMVRYQRQGMSALPVVMTHETPALISSLPALIPGETSRDSDFGGHDPGESSNTGDNSGGTGSSGNDGGGNGGSPPPDYPAGDNFDEDEPINGVAVPRNRAFDGGTQRPGRMAAAFGRGLANIREDWKSHWGKLNYAFAVSAVAQGIGEDYSKNNSGEYLTPEQQSTASASVLPGVGALVGTVAGAAFGAGGAWAGGILGSGAGTLAQSVIGANDQREQAAREASERLAASLGAAADTAEKFKGIIEATGVPVAQLGQGLGALQATGPGVGGGAIAGAARSALAEGEFYAADTAATSKFLASNPALAPLAQTYRTDGELSREQYQSIAGLALSEGNTAEFNAAQMQASRSTLTKDARYQQLAKNQQSDASSWGNQINHFFTEAGHHLGFQWMGMSDEDPIVQDQLALDRRKAEVDKENGISDQNYVQEYADINKSRQDLFDAGLKTKIADAGFSLARVKGASAATLRGLLPGLNASTDAATAADQLLIDTDTKMMAGLAPDDPVRAGYQNDINSARANMVQNPLIKAQRDRAMFDDERQEEAAAYGQFQSAGSLSLTRGRLSGRSNADLQGEEDALIGGQRQYAAQQRQEASNPILRPFERAEILSRANAVEAESAQQAYNFREAGYGQNLGRIALQGDQANLAVTNAQIGGGPSQNYEAAGQVVAAFQAKIGELTNEIQRGGLTVEDRTAKERELTGARAAAERAEDSRNQTYFAAQSQITGTERATEAVGQERLIRRGGNRAFNANILTLDQQAITEAQGHLDFDLAHTPSNTQRIDNDRLALARAQDAPNADLDVWNTYQRDGQTTRRMMNDRAQAQIAELSPWMNGPQSNPLTAHAAEMRDLRGDLAGIEKNRREGIAAERWRDEDETTYTSQRNQDRLELAGLERERVYSGLLPQAVERLIGGERGGIGLAIQPLAAQSAASGATYNPLFGGFGQHASGYMGGGTAHEGGAPGSWFMAAGGQTPGANGSADVVAAIHMLAGIIRHGQEQSKNTSLYAPSNPAPGPAPYPLKNGGL